jgi:hypothetical protein
VLVSEIIGNEPLGESIIETFVDARRRWLKPGASLIPRCVRVLGLPVEIPRETIDRKTFTRRSLANWRDWYGIDFSPLADYGRASSHQFSIKSHDVRSWTRIGPAVMLADVDLATVESPMVERTATAHANRAGELNGVLVYFETELAEGELLSAHPDRSDASNSWTSHIWIAAHPVRLNPGDAFELTYRYGVPGRRQGVTVATAASCPMAKVA